MDERIRRLAIQATAKIALGMTVAGCASSVETQEPVTSYDPPPSGDGKVDGYDRDGYAPPDTTPPDTTPPDPPAPPEELACQAPEVGEVVPLDDEQLACCSDVLAPHFPTDTDGWETWNETSQDKNVQACCNVVRAHADQDFAAIESIGWSNFSACCQALGNPAGACTPWGPPMPPTVQHLPELQRYREVA